MGYKVFLGSAIFICGFYYLAYAFRNSGRLKEGAALFYLLLGIVGIVAGIGLLFGATRSDWI